MKQGQIFRTKGAIAVMLNCTSRTINTYEAEESDPLPVAIRGGNGRPHLYDLAAVHAWGVRRRLAELRPDGAGIAYDFEAERARLTHELADRMALEVAQLKGELLPTLPIVAAWRVAVEHLRRRVLAMPDRAARAVQGAADLAEIRDTLTASCHEILQEIAEGMTHELAAELAEIAEAVAPVRAED